MPVPDSDQEKVRKASALAVVVTVGSAGSDDRNGRDIRRGIVQVGVIDERCRRCSAACAGGRELCPLRRPTDFPP